MDPNQYEENIKKLRAIGQAAHQNRLPIQSIHSEYHRKVLEQAIRNVLSTDLAKFTYAQILDGLPIADVAWDRRLPTIFGDHPIEEHENLCPDAMTKAQEYYDRWNPDVLTFYAKVSVICRPFCASSYHFYQPIKDFQLAQPGTKAFNTRLVELVAAALHQIGVILYQLDFRLHEGDIDGIVNWKFPTEGTGLADINPQPTIFCHHAYLHSDIYPEGVADMVGYWVEDRIIGGVVAFDRRAEEEGRVENIYFHSSREKQTIRVYQLLDEQQQALFDFLLEETSSPPPPRDLLPILGGIHNRVRVDAWIAHTQKLIYRDIWERKPHTWRELEFFQRRPQDELDYPEIRGQIFRINTILGIQLPKREAQSLSSEADSNMSGESGEEIPYLNVQQTTLVKKHLRSTSPVQEDLHSNEEEKEV
ncbi:hypothetical protein BGZ63DRAFT_395034 [Mariannaea sp. PMI_226]|nr:hypothetical protein BGZ63DRAFT_395034 [Mariannaea sp. PMI_226]